MDSGGLHRALAAMGIARTKSTIVRASVALAVLTWAPLFMASVLEGSAVGPPGAFVRDIGVHVRCFLALPLLVLAESVIERRLRGALRYVSDAGLIDARERERAEGLARQVRALHGSVLAHVGIALVVLAVSIELVNREPMVPTWAHRVASNASISPSIAGWIDLSWSAAMYRLIMVRWLFQLGLWSMLLVGLARLPLLTSAVHHDGVGGLGPLVESHMTFAWVVLAISSAFAARLIVHVRLTGHDPLSYAHAIGAFSLLAPLVCLAPLGAFVVPLERDRRRVLHELSIGALEQARRFIHEYATKADRRPLAHGVDDVTIGADLASTYARVYGAWHTPFRREHYAGLFAAAALPMLGFFFATMPLAEVLSSLRALLG